MPDLSPNDLVNMVRQPEEPEPTQKVDRASTEERSIEFFLSELGERKPRGLSPGVYVEILGNKPDDAA